MIIEEYEPSVARKERCILSLEGFSRFFIFSNMMNILDIPKTQAVHQVWIPNIDTIFLTFVARWRFEKSCDQWRHLMARQCLSTDTQIMGTLWIDYANQFMYVTSKTSSPRPSCGPTGGSCAW